MKAIGLLFLVCVLVGCATISVEDRALVKEFDELIGKDSLSESDMSFLRSARVFAAYVTLSEKERESIKNSQTIQDLHLDSCSADDVKFLRVCLTPDDIRFIKRGGLGFDPKDLDAVQIEFDPAQLSPRQKVVVMKIGREIMGAIITGIGLQTR